jgi:DNA sulfur modification protein DndC
MNIQQYIDNNFLFIINHSGGKDSQAMYLYLKAMGIPSSQIMLVHADLGRVEWSNLKPWIKSICDEPLHVALPFDKNGDSKDLLDRVWAKHQSNQEQGKDRPPWPSPAMRWCTSDFKTGPIQREIRQYMKANGFKKAINCLGMRAEESPRRAKLEPFKLNKDLSKAGREVYDWLPVFSWSTGEVFQYIEANGQKPHQMYLEGMTRLSCRFCIMANKADLTIAAKQSPELYREYVMMERRTGYTMQQGKSLEETTGVAI